MGVSLSCSVYAAAPPNISGNSDAGVILNQSREFFRQQEIARELEQEKNRVKDGASVQREEQPQGEQGDIRFVLKDIQFTPSQILTPEELKSIVGPFLDQSVSIKDLYKIVDAINAIYQKRGLVTCRAMLPPQTISSGVVKVELWEGKVGQVKLKANATTNERYIKERLLLKAGSIPSLDDLNRELLWFNGTNDVQLRIRLQAGDVPGTTDYIITAYEPPREQFSLFADNSGSETSGEWREGLSYSNRSLSGRRDQLTIGSMFSKGTTSGSFSYSVPFTTSGSRLGLSYSANSVKIIQGPLRELNTRGRSDSYGISLTQPLSISKERKMEAGVEWNRQSSQTDFLEMRWVDDDINRYSAWFTVTNFGRQQVIYQRHSYTFGTWNNIDEINKHYGKYQFSSLGQKLYAGGQMLTIRLNGQISGTHYLPSAEQFYIGGVYSVRGYKENLLGADDGYSLSLEYTLPVQQKQEVFLFLDGGNVQGDNAFDDHILVGTGCGYRVNFDKNLTASLTLGLPLRREINGEQIDRSRLHVMMSGQF